MAAALFTQLFSAEPAMASTGKKEPLFSFLFSVDINIDDYSYRCGLLTLYLLAVCLLQFNRTTLLRTYTGKVNPAAAFILCFSTSSHVTS